MLKLTFIADTHYYSKRLGITGKQYLLRSGSDQKCLAESEEIITAAFEKIAKSDADYVLIAGDLTNDGEMVSHYEFRKKLEELRKSKKIIAITSTHDWCNDHNPRKFDGDTVSNDVAVMADNSIEDFYMPYGQCHAIEKHHYRTHIGICSYVVQLSDNVRLLALIDDKNNNNHAGFSNEHFNWIERQLKQAKEDGCLVIAMMHHLLTPHISPLITGGATVENNEYVAARLADAGLRYVFVGHSHIQNTTDYISPKGNMIKEINIGSLVGYPAPMVNVTVNDDMTLSYEVDHVQSFIYDGKDIDAQYFLAEHALALVHRILECNTKEEFSERMTALQADGEKLSKFFFAFKPILKFAQGCTIRQLYKKMKLVGMDRFLDKKLVNKFSNFKFMDFVDRIILSAMDGSIISYKRDSDYYKLVMSFVSIPSKLFKKNEDMKKINSAIDAILTGGKYNNQRDTI